MVAKACPDADFIRLIETQGPQKTAEALGVKIRGVYMRRANLEKKIGRQITAPANSPNLTRSNIAHPARFPFPLKDGIAIIGSDAHFWPGIISTAHRAFVEAIKEFRPKLVILNGDVLDGATISRHPPIGWESRPSLIQEIEASQERLAEIEKAAKNAEKCWTLGNHDGRFETRLATVAPEYAKVHGVHLRDHFPAWRPSWSVWINKDTVVKHRIRGGIHATHNNTLNAGLHTVTGHLHSLKVTPFTDYNGTRYGVDTGTLAPVYGDQFTDYMEDGPRSWRSGFVILTFNRGRLLWPEVVHVLDEDSGEVEFRGRAYAV